MQEALLHHIWKFQLFSKNSLKTDEGELLSVLEIGQHNENAGADFLNAKVIIDTITWAGDVEIHIKSSDWYKHSHHKNAAYETVVLHVVWENDQEVKHSNGSLLPTLELKNRVSSQVIEKYENLMESEEKIPCCSQWENVQRIIKVSMLDKVLISRLERKAKESRDLFQNSKKSWEEMTYQLLAQNFGFKLNAAPFLQMAKGLPLNILQKHAGNLLQLEALIFGQSGFLEENFDNSYLKTLQREYNFLAHKYNLFPQRINKSQWKFLRLRPANFPTVRLAQFAVLLNKEKHLFSRFLYAKEVKEIKELFHLEQSDFWKTHYVLEKKSEKEVPNFGEISRDNIIINTVIPLLVAYSNYKKENAYSEKAIRFLENLKPENNHITKGWKGLGQAIKSAFDSQSLIELSNNFCQKKRCLECGIGASLVRK